MNKILVLSFILFLTSFRVDENISIDKKEALIAYELLNNIRTNPKEYGKEFPFLRSLKITNTKLVWNDTLALVAEAKAYDMANNSYFAHVDPSGLGINHYINKSGYKLNPKWIEDKKLNYFESIASEVNNGTSAISIFLIDKGVPSLGHRKHLLGLGDWNASLKDIGIGFARRKYGSKSKTYISLIIAKHDF